MKTLGARCKCTSQKVASPRDRFALPQTFYVFLLLSYYSHKKTPIYCLGTLHTSACYGPSNNPNTTCVLSCIHISRNIHKTKTPTLLGYSSHTHMQESGKTLKSRHQLVALYTHNHTQKITCVLHPTINFPPCFSAWALSTYPHVPEQTTFYIHTHTRENCTSIAKLVSTLAAPLSCLPAAWQQNNYQSDCLPWKAN